MPPSKPPAHWVVWVFTHVLNLLTEPGLKRPIAVIDLADEPARKRRTEEVVAEDASRASGSPSPPESPVEDATPSAPAEEEPTSPPMLRVLPPIPTTFPPTRLPLELLEYGSSPRQRVGIVATKSLKHRSKFTNSRHLAHFDRCKLHASKLYQCVSAPALKEVICVLVDEKCIDGMIEAFDSFLNGNMDRLPPSKCQLFRSLLISLFFVRVLFLIANITIAEYD